MKNSFKYHNLNQYCTVLTYTSGPTERKIRYLFMFLFTFLFQPIFSQSMLKYDTRVRELVHCYEYSHCRLTCIPEEQILLSLCIP